MSVEISTIRGLILDALSSPLAGGPGLGTVPTSSSDILYGVTA